LVGDGVGGGVISTLWSRVKKVQKKKAKQRLLTCYSRHPPIPLLELESGSFLWRKHAGYDKQKDKATYWSSEATATKSSSSDSTITLGLMGFLRRLRLAMERK
jgi:hypothetical protein